MTGTPPDPDDDETAAGEFACIHDLFAPLAADEPGAFGLADDAAVLATGPATVVTTDTLVEGTHFLPADPPADVGRKLLRVNLSDLAAMGAAPRAYFVNVALPRRRGRPWLADFAQGLAADQAAFGGVVAGGDLVATPGPPTLTLTALGDPAGAGVLRRDAARPGDVICVSGTIGDAVLGLGVLTEALDTTNFTEDERAWVAAAYRRPQPRLALGRALVGTAGAGMDVSDGLVADLEHLCAASGVGAMLDAARVPLSAPAGRLVAAEPSRLAMLLAGGDDYELLVTVPGDALPRAETLAAEAGVALTPVGAVVAGSGVRVHDAEGRPLALDSTGWQHF